jgi:hypothetical protein
MPRFSNTRLELYERNKRAYWWKYCRGLVLKEKSINLTIGELYHEGHKRWYHPTSAFMHLGDKITATHEHVEAYAKANGMPPDLMQKVKDMINSLIRCSTEEDDFSPISVEQWIEVPFPMPDRDDVTFVAKLDAVVFTERTGLLRPLEAKTTGAISANLKMLFKEGPQAQSQFWVAKQSLKKEIGSPIFNITNKAKSPRTEQIRSLVNEWSQQRWLTATQSLISEILSRDPANKEDWRPNIYNDYTLFGADDYLLLEKYGEKPETLKAYMPYKEGKPGIKTNGGI